MNSSLPPLVRVHIKDTLRDVVGVRNDRLGWPLRAAMPRVASEASGVMVILRPEQTPREFMDSVRQLEAKTAIVPASGATVIRTYGIGAQILKDLGLKRMRVLSAQATEGSRGFRSGSYQVGDGGELALGRLYFAGTSIEESPCP